MVSGRAGRYCEGPEGLVGAERFPEGEADGGAEGGCYGGAEAHGCGERGAGGDAWVEGVLGCGGEVAAGLVGPLYREGGAGDGGECGEGWGVAGGQVGPELAWARSAGESWPAGVFMRCCRWSRLMARVFPGLYLRVVGPGRCGA